MLSWLRLRRDDPEALLAKGEIERAVELLEAQIEAEPEDDAARRVLAEALAQGGQRDRAVEILFELTEDLANSGQVTKSFAVLKDVERLAPPSGLAPDITRRAWHLMRSASQKATSIPSTTSEIVLEDWLDPAEQRQDFLASPLFHGLDERELTMLFDELRLRRKYSGAVIYAAGEPARGLYVLARGRVRVYQPDEEHRLDQVVVLSEGDIFGLGAVLGKGRRTHTVTAAGRCEILQIGRDVFERLAGAHPEIRVRVKEIAHDRRQAQLRGRQVGLAPA